MTDTMQNFIETGSDEAQNALRVSGRTFIEHIQAAHAERIARMLVKLGEVSVAMKTTERLGYSPDQAVLMFAKHMADEIRGMRL